MGRLSVCSLYNINLRILHEYQRCTSIADIHLVRLLNVRCGGGGGGGGSQGLPNTLVNENVMLAMKYARLN